MLKYDYFMVNESKAELYKKIHSEYHKKLKELESKLAALHHELNQIEQGIQHESKKIYGVSNISTLKAKKVKLDASIIKLTKDIKELNKEKNRKIKRLQKS